MPENSAGSPPREELTTQNFHNVDPRDGGVVRVSHGERRAKSQEDYRKYTTEELERLLGINPNNPEAESYSPNTADPNPNDYTPEAFETAKKKAMEHALALRYIENARKNKQELSTGEKLFIVNNLSEYGLESALADITARREGFKSFQGALENFDVTVGSVQTEENKFNIEKNSSLPSFWKKRLKDVLTSGTMSMATLGAISLFGGPVSVLATAVGVGGYTLGKGIADYLTRERAIHRGGKESVAYRAAEDLITEVSQAQELAQKFRSDTEASPQVRLQILNEIIGGTANRELENLKKYKQLDRRARIWEMIGGLTGYAAGNIAGALIESKTSIAKAAVEGIRLNGNEIVENSSDGHVVKMVKGTWRFIVEQKDIDSAQSVLDNTWSKFFHVVDEAGVNLPNGIPLDQTLYDFTQSASKPLFHAAQGGISQNVETIIRGAELLKAGINIGVFSGLSLAWESGVNIFQNTQTEKSNRATNKLNFGYKENIPLSREADKAKRKELTNWEIERPEIKNLYERSTIDFPKSPSWEVLEDNKARYFIPDLKFGNNTLRLSTPLDREQQQIMYELALESYKTGEPPKNVRILITQEMEDQDKPDKKIRFFKFLPQKDNENTEQPSAQTTESQEEEPKPETNPSPEDNSEPTKEYQNITVESQEIKLGELTSLSVSPDKDIYPKQFNNRKILAMQRIATLGGKAFLILDQTLSPDQQKALAYIQEEKKRTGNKDLQIPCILTRIIKPRNDSDPAYIFYKFIIPANDTS